MGIEIYLSLFFIVVGIAATTSVFLLLEKSRNDFIKYLKEENGKLRTDYNNAIEKLIISDEEDDFEFETGKESEDGFDLVHKLLGYDDYLFNKVEMIDERPSLDIAEKPKKNVEDKLNSNIVDGTNEKPKKIVEDKPEPPAPKKSEVKVQKEPSPDKKPKPKEVLKDEKGRVILSAEEILRGAR